MSLIADHQVNGEALEMTIAGMLPGNAHTIQNSPRSERGPPASRGARAYW